MAVAIDGLCLNGPFLHYAYDALERWIPAEDSLKQATVQVAIDTLILDPVYAFLFIITTGLIEGLSMEREIIPMIRAQYATLVFWLVMVGLALAAPRIYLFRRFPVQWRVLISDICDLLWTAITCFLISPTY